MKKIILISFVALATVITSCSDHNSAKTDIKKDSVVAKVSTKKTVVNSKKVANTQERSQFYNPNLDSLFSTVNTKAEKEHLWLTISKNAENNWLAISKENENKWLSTSKAAENYWLKISHEAFNKFKDKDPSACSQYLEAEKKGYKELNAFMDNNSSKEFRVYQTTDAKAYENYRVADAKAYENYQAVDSKAYNKYQAAK